MFEILFGWRKATRCKRLIKRVQCRLKLLKNKRDSILRQLREDIAELIQRGQEQRAFARVEQLCKDQNIKIAYDLIEHFCEFILINLPYIRRNRDCPNDINEAISSLLFASARCGDLPELQKLRKLFGERYGPKFTVCAVELLAGNLVNCQMIEKLSTKSIPDDVKLGVMKEIARDKKLLLLEYPEDESRFAANPCQTYNSFSTKISSVSDEVEKLEQLDPPKKLERILGTPSECSSNLSERSVVYLDDIEEFKPKVEDAIDKDQRLFMFKSTAQSLVDEGCLYDLYRDGFTRDHIAACEPSDGKTSSWGSSQRRKSSRKRLKRRYQSSILPTLSMKNPEYALYYGETGDSSTDDGLLSRKSQPQRKHQRKMPVEESPRSRSSSTKHKIANKVCHDKIVENFISRKGKYYHEKTHGSCNFNHCVDADCFLEHPCYLRTSDYKDDWENTSPRQCGGSIRSIKSSHKDLKRRELEDSTDDETFSTAASTNHRSCIKELSHNKKDHEISYGNYMINVAPNVVPSPCRGQFKEMNKVELRDCRGSYGYSHDSCSSAMSSSKLTSVRPPYLRATTMPPERPKVSSNGQILRSASCLSQQSNHSERSSSSSSCSHVHPKLPDYDDLAIKFRALREEQMHNSNGEVSSGLGRA